MTDAAPLSGPDMPRKAAGLIVTGMFVIGLVDNLVPDVARYAGLWQFHSLRAAIALPILWGVARFMGWPLWPQNPRKVIARSLAAACAMLVYFGCLAVLPIGQVASGLFTSPIFILILSAMVLGERVGPRQIAAVILGFAGVVCILRPGQTDLNALAAVPVVAGALYALSVLATRHWCSQEHPATLVAAFFLVLGSFGAIGSAALTWGVGSQSTDFATRPWVSHPGDAFYLLTTFQAVGSLCAIAMLVRGYQIASPSRVAPFEFTLLIFAPFWAFVLWGQGLSWPMVFGMALIVISGLILNQSARPA